MQVCPRAIVYAQKRGGGGNLGTGSVPGSWDYYGAPSQPRLKALGRGRTYHANNQ